VEAGIQDGVGDAHDEREHVGAGETLAAAQVRDDHAGGDHEADPEAQRVEVDDEEGSCQDQRDHSCEGHQRMGPLLLRCVG
jgi:hypothetical protein